MSAFESLRADLSEDDVLLAAALTDSKEFEDQPPVGLISGPGIESDPASYRYGLEAIREGHLLHWDAGRLVQTADADLALLAGDRLYAAGLERIAATGDTRTIALLSTLIMDSASAMAADQPDQAELAWEVCCAEIGSHVR